MATSTTLTSTQRQTGSVTLTGSSVDTVTFPRYTSRVKVKCLNGAAEITVVIGSTAATLTDPTVGDRTGYTLPAAICEDTFPAPAVRSTANQSTAATVVKLISAGAASYVVEEADEL